MKIFSTCFALAVLAFPVAHADQLQSLSAQVGDITFESGDEEITLVPIGDKFSLSASTKGAAAWPPPKTRIDRLSITCDGFEIGKPMVLDHMAFSRSVCDVSFEKGAKSNGVAPDATYTLDKDSADNRFEITHVAGKIYKGTFKFRLKDGHGGAVGIANGQFAAEDRQL